MFEFEVDHAVLDCTEIPVEIQARFSESCASVRAFSLIAWEEHCTECAMPQCYTTCDLYRPRKDGKCRRFDYGFGYVQGVPSILGYVCKVSFKRWGQIMAYANMRLITSNVGQRLERIVSYTDNAIAKVPDARLSLFGRRGISSRAMRRFKQWLSHSAPLGHGTVAGEPDCFLVEVYNPEKKLVSLSIAIRDVSSALREMPYQELVVVEPGFSRFRIHYASIKRHLSETPDIHITLCPNLLAPADEGMTLFFGLIGFVQEDPAQWTGGEHRGYEPESPPDGQKHVKVLAWDLDNTLWDGILVEDGEDGVRLKDGVAEVVQELDRRGIVNSVVSKNDFSIAEAMLKRVGLDEYFVYPKVSWGPKSQAVKEIISDFNVGADTVAVIDDSEFERAEIASQCAGVRLYSHLDYRALLAFPEFRPEVSSESARRRAFYRAEEKRSSDRAKFGSDYFSFLKSCALHARVERANDATIDRVHELIQRTNQLNFSGNRYSREAVQAIFKEQGVVPICVSCTDRFGDYGLVGFCLLEHMSGTVRDMMFSCRVQSKRVEHALLCALMAFLKSSKQSRLRVMYRRTARNGPAAQVFQDLGFQEDDAADGGNVRYYNFDLNESIPTQDLVDVEWRVVV